jgi:lantibiotic modifying enzyme
MSSDHPLFLEVADRIGRTLCRDAVWDGKRCNWLGWSMEVVQHKTVSAYRSMGADVYCGTSGIALFLAELHQFTADRQQLLALDGALNQALSVLDLIDGVKRCGFYTGQAGIAHVLIRIGHLLERESLIERGLSIMATLREVPADAQYIDVLGGSAGLIPLLLLLAQKYNRPDLIDMARTHGEHLLKLAIESEHGYSWKTVQMAIRQNLTGHSHGVAGIVTALLELHHVTGEQRFLQAAMQGLRYETSLFNTSLGNWPDFRVMSSAQAEPGQNYSLAWCHGAPGIGLARLRNVELQSDNDALLRDLDAAINTTSRILSQTWVPGTGTYSLCHGASGNAELLILAGQRRNRPELTRLAEKVGHDGYRFYVQQGLPWPCGVPNAGETPNLMLGTAGIGHFYLRLHDPLAVPSILLITPDNDQVE